MNLFRLVFVIEAMVVLLAASGSSEAADCLPSPTLSIRPHYNPPLIDVAGEPGSTYVLDRSENLYEWTPLWTNWTSSGEVSFSTPSASAIPQFFRARSVDSINGAGASFIFDGETFSGWEGDTANVFRIENCALVGSSLAQPISENKFLCTTRQYTHFILRLEFKLVGTNGFVNSGIQFRSQRVPGTQQVSGYQADMGTGLWGNLYDESRRNVTLASANQASVAAVFHENDWNSYVIQAGGANIQIWINGYQAINYTEAAAGIPQNGIIGLQIHSGGRLEASFRRISVEVFP